MAITLDIKSELPTAIRWTNEHTKQLPFSIAQAMTASAKGITSIPGSKQKSALNALQGSASRFLKQPKPQTAKGFRATTANKRTLRLMILPKDKPWDRNRYLSGNILGGQRAPKPYEIAFAARSNGDIQQGSRFVPTGAIKPDAFGNVSKANIRRVINSLEKTGRGRTMIGRPEGTTKPLGVYRQEAKGRLRPLFLVKPVNNYTAVFPAQRIAEDKIRSVFGLYLRDRLARNVSANVKAGRADMRTGIF
nr:phage minor tail protein Z [uncultured Mediterranean phage uvMED]